MQISSARFVKSSTKIKDCPNPDLPEYAFIGRSNVGKSSLINMLTNIKGLAKTSSTPGKTQLINHFIINDAWYLVDLPGYGFAKVSKSEKKKWDQMISEYILKRANLMSVFVLIDSRIKPQQIDIDFINNLGMQQVPICILVTKSDKISQQQVVSSVMDFKNKLSETWEELPDFIITSSKDKTGRESILKFIDKANKLFQKP